MFLPGKSKFFIPPSMLFGSRFIVSDSYKIQRDYVKLATPETTWEFPASKAMRITPPSYGLVDGRKRLLIPKDSKYGLAECAEFSGRTKLLMY